MTDLPSAPTLETVVEEIRKALPHVEGLAAAAAALDCKPHEVPEQCAKLRADAKRMLDKLDVLIATRQALDPEGAEKGRALAFEDLPREVMRLRARGQSLSHAVKEAEAVVTQVVVALGRLTEPGMAVKHAHSTLQQLRSDLVALQPNTLADWERKIPLATLDQRDALGSPNPHERHEDILPVQLKAVGWKSLPLEIRNLCTAVEQTIPSSGVHDPNAAKVLAAALHLNAAVRGGRLATPNIGSRETIDSRAARAAERGPDVPRRECVPEPDRKQVVLPWRSTPDPMGDYVEVSHTGIRACDAHDGDLCVSLPEPAEIPTMARAMYQVYALPWPGDEVERLRAALATAMECLVSSAERIDGTGHDHNARTALHRLQHRHGIDVPEVAPHPEAKPYDEAEALRARVRELESACGLLGEARRDRDTAMNALQSAAETLQCAHDQVPEQVRLLMAGPNAAQQLAYDVLESAAETLECTPDQVPEQVRRLAAECRRATEAAEGLRAVCMKWEDECGRLAGLVNNWKAKAQVRRDCMMRAQSQLDAATDAHAILQDGLDGTLLPSDTEAAESGCMPEVMAVVEAWGELPGATDIRVLGDALDALRNAIRSGKRCGLHPATEVLKRARAVVDQRPHCGTFMREHPLLSEAIKCLEVELRNLPREGGES
jgi:hypothetical protein